MKIHRALLVVALLLSPLTFVVRAEEARARGVIRAVDLQASTVTLNTRDARELTLKVNERTEIIRNGEPARLSDLQQGDRATAVYDSDTFVASHIEARGEGRLKPVRIEGTITAVDTGTVPGTGTVTIEPLRDGRAVTLNVTRETEITLDGRPARLDDLARGFNAGALYNPNTFDALRINAESFAEVRGIVRDVGYTEGTLTIESSNGDIVRLLITEHTTISLNDRPATLQDLRRGFRVVASFVESTHVALRVVAESIGEVTGHIRAVDLSSATVVIAPLVGGPAVELHVTHSTRISIGGEPASLDQLQVGMGAHATFSIVSFEAFTIQARPLGDECTEHRVAGRIAEVSLHSSTVTIDPGEGGERVTLNVTPRTEITIGGRPARLSDLQVGMRASAVFCRENLTAKIISVRGGSR